MDDWRVKCTDCAGYVAGSGKCRPALRGERLDVSTEYSPVLEPPRNCEHFTPRPDNPDRRNGRERFPWLWAQYQELYGQKPTTKERFKRMKDMVGK